MLHGLRTYRWLSLLTACTLLLGAALPLVQPVCAQMRDARSAMPTDGPHAAHPCCLDEAEPPAPPGPSAPCHDDGDAGLEGPCCALEPAGTTPLVTLPLPTIEAPHAAVLAVLPGAEPEAPAAAAWKPPPEPPAVPSPPVALHLLCAVFLI